MVRKIISTAALLLTITSVNAQTIREEWKNFLHPRISQLSMIYNSHNFTTSKNSLGAFAIATASFNRGGIIEFSTGYYITKNTLYGLDLTVRPTKNLTFKAGIQRLPNLMEANANLATHPFMGFSQQVSYLGGYRDLSGLSTRGKDCGLSVDGNFFHRDGYSVLNVVAGVFNGAGLTFKDIDNKKDFAGRIVIQPCEAIKLYAGALIGYYTLVDDEGVKGETLRKQRLSSAFTFEKKGWFYKIEGVYGLTDQLESFGISTYGGKAITPTNTVAVKFDRFQKDIHLEGNATSKAGIGLMHSFGHGVSFKGHYEHTFGNDTVVSSDAVLLCLTLSFSAQL